MKVQRITCKEELSKGIQLWNRYNSEYKIRQNLILQNVYAPFAGVNITAWGGYKEEKLVAFALLKYLKEEIPILNSANMGWISLFVREEDRVNAEESQVFLKKLEDELCRLGVSKIRFGGDPQNFLPGLPALMEEEYLPLFKSRGFKEEGRVYDLYQDIEDLSIPRRIKDIKANLGDTLQAGPVTKEEEDDLIDFLKEHFPGRWQYEAENIARIPGGVEDYWLLRYEGKPVGFVRTNTSNSSYQGPNVNWGNRYGDNFCGLGPIGIAGDYRGRGWGLFLMAEVIMSMQKGGFYHMIIDWTGLVEYYQKLGFETCDEYISLIKKLEG